MKKTLPLILPVLIFLPALLYLHQKVQIYVEAYRLSSNYSCHNELVDKKDYLRYNFTKETSLLKVNQWAQAENFVPVDKENILALAVQHKQPAAGGLARLFGRFLSASTPASEAFAKDSR